MKIIAKEEAVRYHVEFDEEETAIYKSIGFLPPYAKSPARLWLTEKELDETRAMLDYAKKERRETAR